MLLKHAMAKHIDEFKLPSILELIKELVWMLSLP